ncbi:MAG: lipid-A-disaccharide synthase [Nitrospinota bacterium]
MMTEKQKDTVVIIAGEPSGDMYGGMLLLEMKKLVPDLKVIGIGGDSMEKAGAELICHVKDTAVMGLVEMVDKIGLLYKKYREILSILGNGRVLGLVLIDYPDFNLRVAVSAKKKGVPVFYYISPQVWAWRKWRIRTIQKCIDKMIVILPFEKNFYRNSGVASEFFGHPLVDLVKPGKKEALKRDFGIVGQKPVIGILPGSRKKEVKNLFPEILEASRKIKKIYPSASFLLPVSGSLDFNFVKSFISASGLPVVAVRERNYDVMRASDVLITKSGTSTLEASIVGTPMVIVYKASFFSVFLARHLVKIQFVGLPNLLSGKMVVTELLQGDMTWRNIVKEVRNILDNKGVFERQVRELGEVSRSLGQPGASKRVAMAIVSGLKVFPGKPQ